MQRRAGVIAAILVVLASLGVILRYGPSSLARITGQPEVRADGPPLPGATGKLAYVRDGDVWTYDLRRGAERRITRGGGASAPKWSGTGGWISFEREGRLWIVKADGTGAIAVPGGDVPESAQWAPRGNRLAYTSSDASLTLYQPDNGSLTRREVLPAGSGAGRHVAWTSDGDTGAYERHQMVGQGLSSESLWTQAITGRSAQPVYSAAGNYSLTLCCWTGSAQYLLFWQGPLSASLAADGFPLYVVRATSSQPVQISAAMLPYSDWVAAVASTDVLAFIAGTGREMTAGKSLVLAAASPASTGEVAVRSITMESDPNLAPASPAWRPRTSTLAYSVGPSLVTAGGDLAATLAGRHIWLVQADSSDKHALLSEATVPNGVSDERPLWSTDGKVLIFARRLQPAAAARAGSTPTPGALELWISSPTGTDARRVVGGLADPGLGSFGHVDWSAVYSYLPD